MAYVKKEPLCAWLEHMGVSAYIVNTIQDEAHFPAEDVVEVKHGEWIYDHWCEFKCSICGHWSQTEPRGKEKYCQNCGTKMDGRKE